ncbi:hypothetical protein ACJX0J_035261, partial [Zea mays]
KIEIFLLLATHLCLRNITSEISLRSELQMACDLKIDHRNAYFVQWQKGRLYIDQKK